MGLVSATACWPNIGPEANNNTTVAIAIVPNVMLVFEFISCTLL
jgi:hypothetical protein